MIVHITIFLFSGSLLGEDKIFNSSFNMTQLQHFVKEASKRFIYLEFNASQSLGCKIDSRKKQMNA